MTAVNRETTWLYVAPAGSVLIGVIDHRFTVVGDNMAPLVVRGDLTAPAE